MDDFQTTTKGGKQQAKKPFETPLPSVLDEQREQNKKKKKEANKFIYGGAAATEEDAKVEEAPQQVVAPAKMKEEPVAAAESGSDSEGETKASSKKHQQKMAERNKNKNKKGGKGGKGKKGGNQSDEEQGEEDEEEKKEEVKVTKPAGEREPIEVVYCKVCGIPPEYCMHDKKDSSECKAWVKSAHPDLFEKIYGEVIVPAEEGKEEVKEEDGQQQKKKKKKSLAPSGNTDIKVYKAKRGGKKMICSVVGLEHYGVPLKDIAKVMGKKFACGCAVAIDDKYGECIQIQGDVQERFYDFVEKELEKYKIPIERVKFEEVKKKKKAEGAEAAEGGDDQE